MKDIFIIGAGGFAKEVYFLLKSLPTYNLSGFVEISPVSNEMKIGNNVFPIIEEKYFLESYKSVDVCIGSGIPQVIKKINSKYENFNFPNLIHPSFVGDKESISMGVGNIITAGVIFTVNIRIGNYNVFNLGCTVGHDCRISNSNVFNPSTNISGNCSIGDGNLFGVGSLILEKKLLDLIM
jgi:NDP-sugar pyrophosphorylase family protein